MNYRLLVLGLIFLFNPEITIIDLIPDFIGFLLIAKAMAPLSAVSPSAENAVTLFRKLAAVSGVQMLAVLPMMSVSASEPSMTLLFTTGFAVVSMLYLLPAIRDLFQSIRYFSEREAVRVRGIGFVKGFTFLSFLLRYVLALLPETVYLYADEERSFLYGTPIYPLVEYRMGITLLSAILSFLVGLVWLFAILIFIKNLKRNAALNEGIAREIASAPHSVSKTILSSVRPALLLLTVASFCTVGYTIDGMPLIPSAASPILILTAMILLRRILSLSKRNLVLPTLASVIGLLSYGSVYHFSKTYHVWSTVGFDTIKKHFLLPAATELISAVLLVLCLVFCVAPALRQLIDRHTGAFWEAAYLSHNSSVARERRRLQFGVSLSVTLLSVSALLRAVSYALYYQYPLLQFIAAFLGLGGALYTAFLLSSIRQSVHEKYTDASSR